MLLEDVTATGPCFALLGAGSQSGYRCGSQIEADLMAILTGPQTLSL
jgi:hypothetical protein